MHLLLHLLDSLFVLFKLGQPTTNGSGSLYATIDWCPFFALVVFAQLIAGGLAHDGGHSGDILSDIETTIRSKH